MQNSEDNDKKRKYPKGTVAWKQGFIWIIKVPPIRGTEWSTIYSRYAPADALKRKRTPRETIYERGGTPPDKIVHRMGALTATYRSEGADKLLFTPNVKIKSSKVPAFLKSKTPRFM